MQHKVAKRDTADGNGKIISTLINDIETISRNRNKLTPDERKELSEKLRNFINNLNDDKKELNDANASNALHESNTNSNYELITSLTNAADKNENNYTNLINDIAELRKSSESFRNDLEKLRKEEEQNKSFKDFKNEIYELRYLNTQLLIEGLRHDVDKLRKRQENNTNLENEITELRKNLDKFHKDEAENKNLRIELDELRKSSENVRTDLDELCKEEQEYNNTFKNEIIELRNLTMQVRIESSRNDEKLRKANKNDAFESCDEALRVESNHEGVYDIYLPKSGLEPFKVYCMYDDGIIENSPRNGTAWTIILRRQDGTIDFNRDWLAYEHGFGNLNGEYFIGLQKLHALTQREPQELYVKLMDFEDNTRYATYDNFQIGAVTEKYSVNNLGTYSGNAGDALGDYVGMNFSTRDSDNDEWGIKSCAHAYKGANWYKICQLSSLFGPYKHEDEKNLLGRDNGKAVTWYPWLGERYSLKYAHMALRPVYTFN